MQETYLLIDIADMLNNILIREIEETITEIFTVFVNIYTFGVTGMTEEKIDLKMVKNVAICFLLSTLMSIGKPNMKIVLFMEEAEIT